MYKTKLIFKYLLIVYLIIFIPGFISAAEIVIQPEDVTVSAIVSSVTPPPSPGGGGGGGDYTFRTSVSFLGFAYPEATVHIWKNGSPLTSMIANSQGEFNVSLDEPYSTNAIYTLYAIDKQVRRSLLLNYPIVITNGYLTQIKGIRFAPTISTDKSQVKQGDTITISGYALPDKEVEIVISGKLNQTFTGVTNRDGAYSFVYQLTNFPKGDYDVRINYKNDKRNSKVVKFIIGDINVLNIESVNNIPGDCNADQTINIVDFSVLAFWYGKDNPPRCVDTNYDGIINLIDFSILAFYWTG